MCGRVFVCGWGCLWVVGCVCGGGRGEEEGMCVWVGVYGVYVCVGVESGSACVRVGNK